MSAEEIHELKCRHFETMQNLLTMQSRLLHHRADVEIAGLDRELVLTGAIVEALGLLEQGEPTLAINTLKAALKHGK